MENKTTSNSFERNIDGCIKGYTSQNLPNIFSIIYHKNKKIEQNEYFFVILKIF